MILTAREPYNGYHGYHRVFKTSIIVAIEEEMFMKIQPQFSVIDVRVNLMADTNNQC